MTRIVLLNAAGQFDDWTGVASVVVTAVGAGVVVAGDICC
jgi:hypothetical protein